MPFVLRPSRNATLQLAYALLAAEERKSKKTKPEREVEAKPAQKHKGKRK